MYSTRTRTRVHARIPNGQVGEDCRACPARSWRGPRARRCRPTAARALRQADFRASILARKSARKSVSVSVSVLSNLATWVSSAYATGSSCMHAWWRFIKPNQSRRLFARQTLHTDTKWLGPSAKCQKSNTRHGRKKGKKSEFHCNVCSVGLQAKIKLFEISPFTHMY